MNPIFLGDDFQILDDDWVHLQILLADLHLTYDPLTTNGYIQTTNEKLFKLPDKEIAWTN